MSLSQSEVERLHSTAQVKHTAALASIQVLVPTSISLCSQSVAIGGIYNVHDMYMYVHDMYMYVHDMYMYVHVHVPLKKNAKYTPCYTCTCT